MNSSKIFHYRIVKIPNTLSYNNGHDPKFWLPKLTFQILHNFNFQSLKKKKLIPWRGQFGNENNNKDSKSIGRQTPNKKGGFSKSWLGLFITFPPKKIKKSEIHGFFVFFSTSQESILLHPPPSLTTTDTNSLSLAKFNQCSKKWNWDLRVYVTSRFTFSKVKSKKWKTKKINKLPKNFIQSLKMTESARPIKGFRQSGVNFLANKYDSEKLDWRSR